MTENPQNEPIIIDLNHVTAVPMTIEYADLTVDITSAERVVHANGLVTSLVTWEEWPREAEPTS